jgi:DNA-binding response OmpR family regulator
MDDRGRILLVDDDETFLSSTALVLENSGYECNCETDGFAAARRLGKNTYDLLISDIKIKGNENLELIYEAMKSQSNIPVILITDQPSLKTAIRSIKMSVVSYLVKPIEYEELLEDVRLAVRRNMLTKEVRACSSRIKALDESLVKMEEIITRFPVNQTHIPFEMFVALTTQNLIDCALDLKKLISSLNGEDRTHICQLYRCPRIDMIKHTIKDSIEVLEYTKKSFKSKELAELRKKLQALITEI